MNIEAILPNIIELAETVGKYQLTRFRQKNLQIEHKKCSNDLVTEVDKESERQIISYLQTHYPEWGILSEECGILTQTSPYQWVVDPLDGTTNFSHGYPIFSISIALEYKGSPVLGVVHVPYLRETYSAAQGLGAFCNKERLYVSSTQELSQALVATGFPYDKHLNPDNNVSFTASLVPKIRCLRRSGSAAFDLCCVAAGFLDAFWESALQRWDVAAGSIIVQEAGGEVISYRKDRGQSIIAGNSMLVQKLKHEAENFYRQNY